MRSLAVSIVAAVLLVAPASAHAGYGLFTFIQNADATGRVTVNTLSLGGPAHMNAVDVVRGGAVVAASVPSTKEPALDLPNLVPGDVARLYRDGEIFTTATYAGQPTFGADACWPNREFTVNVPPAYHGIGARLISSYLENSTALPGTGKVHFHRPLAAGDEIDAQVQLAPALQNGGGAVLEERHLLVPPCPRPPAPATTPTDRQVRASLKAALAKAAKTLRRVRLAKRMRVPIALSEAGRISLKLSARRVTVARGVRTARAGTVKVTLKRTARGAKVRTRKMVLKATFKPARASAKAQTLSARATLK